MGLFVLGNVTQAVVRSVVYNRSDFNAFLRPAIEVRFFDKNFLIDFLFNSYPPFFYTLISLFSPFALWFSSLLWALSICLLSYYCFFLCFYFIEKSSGRIVPYKWLSFFICIPLIATNIHMGQSNTLVLFLILLGMVGLYAKEKYSAWIGFAIALKVTPLIIAFFMFLKGKVRSVGYIAATTLLLLFLVPIFFYGFEKSMEMNSLWVKNVLAPFFSGQEIGTSNTGYYHSNQSLDAFINRHFTNYAVEKYGGLHKKIDWVIFSENQAKFVGMLIKTILVMGMSVLTFWKRNCKTTWFYELSAWLILLLWISPSSWINHYIFTMPAVCCLLLGVDLKKPLQFKNNFSLWMLIWFLFFIHLGYGSYMQSFSPIFLGSISLLLGCIHLLVKEKKTHMPSIG